jgi:hypothetical protein
MSLTYAFYSTIFALLLYIIITDQSVAIAFVLLTKILKVSYERMKWWLLHNPSNPFIKWIIWNRSVKIAKQLKKEFDQRS